MDVCRIRAMWAHFSDEIGVEAFDGFAQMVHDNHENLNTLCIPAIRVARRDGLMENSLHQATTPPRTRHGFSKEGFDFRAVWS